MMNVSEGGQPSDDLTPKSPPRALKNIFNSN